MTPHIQDYRTIPLTRGQVAIVDTADHDWLAQWKWYLSKDRRGRYYAARCFQIAPRKWGVTSMHRDILLLAPGDKRQGDHVNGDSLDNRRCNLRIASLLENARNRRLGITNTSGFKGVSRDKSCTKSAKWRAAIRIDGKRTFLGNFNTPEEAHAAYCAAAAIHFGDFARTS